MSDIEARLLLRAQFGDAIKALGDVQRELKKLVVDAGAAGQGASAGLGAIDSAAKQTAAAQTTAATEVTQAKATQEAKQTADAAAGSAQRKKVAADEAQAQKAAAAAAASAAREKALAEKAIRDQAEKDARAAANQARQLGPQLTDIVVGLSTGQSPFTVLLQQGGQLKDVFGGIGNAVKALASIFTPLRLVIGGVAAILGTFAFQAYQAWKDTDELNKGLALTGNIAQTSAGQVDAAATRLAAAQKTSVASAREALAAAAGSGNFIGASYESAARAGQALAKLSGQTAAEEIKNWGDMSNGVADSAVKLNKSYHFLTLAEFDRIAAMEAAGNKQEAMRELLDKLAATMEQRAVPVVTGFALGWQNLKRDISNALDALRGANKDLGTNTAATEAAIAAQQRYIQEKQAKGLDTSGAQVYLNTLQAQLAQIKANAAAQTENQQQRQRDEEVELKGNKAYQDALAQTDQAGLRSRFAALQADLEARRGLIERANAKGLLTAEQYAAQTNAVDVAAAKLKLKLLEDQQAQESRRQYTQPAEQQAQRARLVDLSAQIQDQQAQLVSAESKGRATLDALTLQRGREAAEEWSKAWTSAYNQVKALSDQNAEAAAQRLTDPLQRAEAEAAARVAGLKRQIEDLRRDVQLRIDITVDPAQKKALEDQLKALNREAQISVDEQGRSAKFDSLRRQAAEQLDLVRVKQDQLSDQERTGALTTLEAEQLKRQAREDALPTLEKILAALREIQSTDGDQAAIGNLGNQIDQLKVKSNDLAQIARRTLSSSFSTLFDDIATGTKKADRAFGDFLINIAKAALNLITQNLGEQLAQSLLPSAGGSGAFGAAVQGIGGWFLDSFSTFQLHSGGIVGTGGQPRTASFADFVNAPRYHSGGIAGLRPNEIPAILEKGEEVLTADDPRHSKNSRFGVSVGDINVSVSVGSAGGSADGAALGQRLGEAVKQKVYEVLTEESREGGLVARAAR